jgi:signal transduction histidine kinase/PAS domain-containing protein
MTDSFTPTAPWPPTDAVEARIDTLLEIARTINSELDLERLFWVIYEQCSRVFDTRNFLLATCDSDGDNIEIKVWFYRGRQLQQSDLHEGRLQGLSPEVIRTRRPLAVPDYIAAIHERGLIVPTPTDEQEHLTWMGVPILIGERLIGVLATSRPGLPYTNEDLHLFQAIAAQCAVAIENANLLGMVSETVRELVRRTDELQGLNVISAAVNRSLDLPTVLEQGIVAVRRVSGWEVATIRLWNPATQTWDLAAQEGLPEGFPFDGPINPSSPIYPYIEEMLAERFPVLLDTTTDPVLASYRAFGQHGVLFPLQIGDEVLGLLLLGTSRPLRGIGPGAMMADQTLLAIGDQLAMAIQNARLLTDVQTARSHLAAVLDTTNDGVIFYDKGGHIELANRAVHALYGVPPGTFRGKTYPEVSDILRPLLKDPTVLDQMGEQMEADPNATTIAELELVRPTRRILSRLTTPVVDEKGEQIGRLSAYHDITEANDLARRTQELAGLNAVAMATNRSFDLKTVLGLAAESLLKVTGWDTATLRLWNPLTRRWELGARRGVAVPGFRPDGDESVSEQDPLYESATPELLAGHAVSIDPTGNPALSAYRDRGLLRLVMLPVQTRGQVLGIIVLGALHSEAAQDAEVMLTDSTLAAVGEQLAVAVENARLQSQAQQAAALEERHRLARDLHDSVTQSLFTVTLMAEAAQAMIDRDPVRVAGYLERLKDTAHTALAEMRALLNQLRPQGLSAAGLGAALRKHAETVGAQVGLAVTVNVDGNLPDLSPAIEEALYRIAQEALHNVVKHAQATEACITLNALRPRPDAPPQAVVLSVEDDGRGFVVAPAGTGGGGGLGLTSMRERATGLGGSFAIGPRPDGGIVVTVAIPLT